MIVITNDGFPNISKTTYSIRRIESGDYMVSRKTPYSEEQQFIQGHKAEVLERLLQHMPGPKGANDVEGLLYDGDLLTIVREEDSKTTIALSLPFRKESVLWWNEIKDLIKNQ